MDKKTTDAVMIHAEQLGFGDVHIKFDAATGLRAIVAIHSTKNGPALGGCRCITYSSADAAFYDAFRLARGMSYKAAISNIPHGGGKAVLMKPTQITDKKAYFRAFGRFVEELGGRYITAVDSGSTVTDMDVIAECTNYVASSSKLDGDPSPATAEGVLHGIEAAVKFKLGKENLAGVAVAIQGLGHVGYDLARRLHQCGAKLTLADVNPTMLEQAAREFNAATTTPDKIHAIPCDVFSPCALGAILNDLTLPQISAKIIAGCANNQLAEPRHGEILQQRGILYAPDYVINAGGLIYAATKYNTQFTHTDPTAVVKLIQEKIRQIYDTLLSIFQRAATENCATSDVADRMAAEKL